MREGLAQAEDAIAEGVAFAQRAWRGAWAPLAISAAGQAAMFVADRLGAPPQAADALRATGFALVLMMFASKLGALHRGALGEAPADLGGLQLGRAELRLGATAVALAGFALLAGTPVLVAAVALLALLQPLGVLQLGGTSLSWGFLLLAPGGVAAGAAGLAGLGRLAVTLPADAAEPSPRFARGWELTRGRGLASALVLLVTFALPVALIASAPALLDRLPTGEGAFGRSHTWPLAEALLAGAALALLTQFVFAPMNAGALAHLYRTGRAREVAAPNPDWAANADGAQDEVRDTAGGFSPDPLAT